MTKGSDCFFSLDDKSKHRYKVKINNMHRYNPDQIKRNNFQAILVNFHQFSDISIIVNY